MTFVSTDDAVRFFVDEDPKVDAAYRNLRVAKSEAEQVIMNHIGHLDAGAFIGGARFSHRYLKVLGLPVRVHVTHHTIRGNLARIQLLLPTNDQVIMEQEITLTDLFPQVGGWITEGPRPTDLA